jgi:hypothetical protein
MNEYKERLKTTLLRRLDYAYNTLKLRNLKDYNFKTNGIYGVYVELLRYLYGDKIVTADELRQKGLDFIQNIR